MVSRLLSRLRSVAMPVAAVAVAAGALLGVAYVQERVEDRTEAASLLLELQVELQREAIRTEGGPAATPKSVSRRTSRELLDELRDKAGNDVDVAAIESRLAAAERAADRQDAASDPATAKRIHEREVEPAVERAATLLTTVFDDHYREAASRQQTADIQSAITLLAAFALALLAFWRFRVARARLAEAELAAAEERVLRESQERLRRLADHASDSFILFDRSGQIVDVNDAACRAHGYERDEMVALTVVDLVVTTTPARLATIWETIAETGTLTREGVHRRRDGSTFPVETSLGTFDADGRTLMLAVVRDVSVRHQAEARLRSQAQLLDKVEAAVIATDPDGRATHWNRAAEQMFGWSREEALGNPVERLGLQRRGSRVLKLPPLRDEFARGERTSWEGELEMATRDGDRFPAYVTIAALRDETGELTGFVGVGVDVSESKRIERELAKRAEQQAAVAELGRRAIAAADLGELMSDATDTLATTLDVELPGIFELLPGGRELRLLTAAAEEDAHLIGKLTIPAGPETLPGYTLARDEPVVSEELENETRFRPPGAALERGARSALTTVIQGTDGPFGVLCVLAREQRRFTPDDVNFLQAVANVLSAAVTRRREAELEAELQRSRRLESVGKLAGGVAHDFNNLLAVILNFADFAIDESEPGSQQRDDLEEIRKAAERAAELTRQLLLFSRRDPVETEVVDVNAVIAGTEALLRRTIGGHIHLRSDLDPELPATRVGAGQMEPVLVNLALNARDAMPSGGELAIATAAEGDWILLTVTDTGTGMAPEVAARAFDPFFTTKPLAEGTGLGLATVYGIVSQAGGEVTIDSELGRGTEVAIRLPAVGREPASPAERVERQRGDGETILVVEDEEQVRRLTRRMLTENGYRVLEAPDGPSALDLAGEHVDLLLTDVVLPQMSGAELAERLLERHPAARVLYMSGYTADIVLRHGPSDAQAAVLEKPFSGEELLGKVRELLGVPGTLIG